MQNRTTTESVDAYLARLAAERYGLFTHAEAVGAGATKNLIARRIADGRWERLRERVYRIAGAPPTWHQSLGAVLLMAGSPSGASHRSAAAVWHLPPFEPGPLEISVPQARRIRDPDVVVHRVKDLGAHQLVVVDSIPVTIPPRTIIDLAAVAPLAEVEEALDTAIHRKLVSIAWLRWYVNQVRRPGRAGIAVVERLLAARGDAETESPLEDKVLALIRRARLPEPVTQYPLFADGRFVARIDLAYPEMKIAIEADGYTWHKSKARWQRDLTRGNNLLELGWKPLRFTKDDVEQRPDEVVHRIATAVAARRAERRREAGAG